MKVADIVEGPGTVRTGEPYANRGSSHGNGGQYDRLDDRLRKVEESVVGIQTELKHLATRAWVLGGVVGGMVSAAIITLTIIRLFS